MPVTLSHDPMICQFKDPQRRRRARVAHRSPAYHWQLMHSESWPTGHGTGLPSHVHDCRLADGWTRCSELPRPAGPGVPGPAAGPQADPSHPTRFQVTGPVTSLRGWATGSLGRARPLALALFPTKSPISTTLPAAGPAPWPARTSDTGPGGPGARLPG